MARRIGGAEAAAGTLGAATMLGGLYPLWLVISADRAGELFGVEILGRVFLTRASALWWAGGIAITGSVIGVFLFVASAMLRHAREIADQIDAIAALAKWSADAQHQAQQPRE